jgi:hypothetical protein
MLRYCRLAGSHTVFIGPSPANFLTLATMASYSSSYLASGSLRFLPDSSSTEFLSVPLPSDCKNFELLFFDFDFEQTKQKSYTEI